MTEKKSKPARKEASSPKSAQKSAAKSVRPATAQEEAKAARRVTPNKPATTKPSPGKGSAARAGRGETTAGKKNAIAAAKITPPRNLPAERDAAPGARLLRTDGPAVKATTEERYRMVQTAAYFIAERHGFQGHSDDHWAAAEREIAARFGW